MSRSRLLLLLTGVLAGVLVAGTVLPAVATFSSGRTISTSVSTATVTPPGNVSATGPWGPSCPGTTETFTASWAPSTFSGATGYHVQSFWSTGGAAILDTTTGPGATSATTPQAVTKPAGAQTVTVLTTVTTLSGTNWTAVSPQASYTCSQPSIGAPSPTSGSVGSSVTVTGIGFLASAPLTVTFGSTAATITNGGTTSANGEVNATFTVPFSGNGSYPITVSDGRNSITSATSYTVTGSFDGVTYTGIAMSGKATDTCSSATIGQDTTCTASPLGGTGSFSGYVTFVTAAHAAVTNTGSALTVTSAETTVSKPGGTVTPASATVATGAASSSSAFMLTGNGGGWQAMTCSVTVNGVTYTVAVTGH